MGAAAARNRRQPMCMPPSNRMTTRATVTSRSTVRCGGASRPGTTCAAIAAPARKNAGVGTCSRSLSRLDRIASRPTPETTSTISPKGRTSSTGSFRSARTRLPTRLPGAPWSTLVLGRGARRAHLLVDRVDDGRVGEGRDVTELAVLGDVAQQPAHDLAAARLRQLRRDQDLPRLRDRADLLGDVVAQLLQELLATGDVVRDVPLRRHERDDRLAGRGIGRTHDGGLGDRRMAD